MAATEYRRRLACIVYRRRPAGKTRESTECFAGRRPAALNAAGTAAIHCTLGLIALLLLIPLGCTPKVQRLEVIRVGNVRLDSVTPQILTMRAELTIRNPYTTSARLKNITFELALTDHFIAYAKRTDSIELKGAALATLDVPLAVQIPKVTEKDLSALLSEKIPYHIRGSAILERPFGPRTLPVEIRNTIVAPDRLKIFLQDKTTGSILSLQKFKTREFLSFLQNQKLPVRFNNPFQFPLTIRDFHYEVKWANQSVVRGESLNELRLEPGENRVELDVIPRPMGALHGIFQGLIDRQLPDLTLISEFRIARQKRDLTVKLIAP